MTLARRILLAVPLALPLANLPVVLAAEEEPAAETAPPVTSDDIVALVTFMRGNGCRIGMADIDNTELDIGVDRARLEDTLVPLMLNGLTEINLEPPQEVTLNPALCDPGSDSRGAIIAAFRLNDCLLDDEAAEQVIPALGLRADLLMATGLRMGGVQEVEVHPEGNRLIPALCEGTGAEMPSPRGAVLNVLRGGECDQDEEDYLDAMATLGHDRRMARGYLEMALRTGLAERNGDRIRLAPAACAGGAAPDGTQPDQTVIEGAGGPDPVEELMQLVRTQGCSIEVEVMDLAGARLEAMLTRFDHRQVAARLDAMFALRDYTLEDGIVSLSPAVCAGQPGRFDTLSAAFEEELGRRGCTMTRDDVTLFAANSGYVWDDLNLAIEGLSQMGRVDLGTGNAVLLPPHCPG